MSGKWYAWCIGKSSLRESSFFVVTGACITLISLVMPWFDKVYRFSSTTISAVEIMGDFLFRDRIVPFYSVTAIAFLVAVSLSAPFLKKRLAALLALPASGLLAAMLYLNAVPFERFTWGLIVTGTGLVLMSLGILGRE